MDILKTKEFARNMYQIPSFLVALNQHRESFPRRLKEGKGKGRRVQIHFLYIFLCGFIKLVISNLATVLPGSWEIYY